MLTKEYLHEIFEYRNGELYWKNHRYKNFNGKKAGTLHHTGYWHIKTKNKVYLAHRLIYLYHHGFLPNYGLELDHINRNRTDNRIENLRVVTKSENERNKLTTSKIYGITWHKKNKKWQVQLRINGKQKYLGVYNSLDIAKNVLNLYKEFANNDSN